MESPDGACVSSKMGSPEFLSPTGKAASLKDMDTTQEEEPNTQPLGDEEFAPDSQETMDVSQVRNHHRIISRQ